MAEKLLLMTRIEDGMARRLSADAFHYIGQFRRDTILCFQLPRSA